MYCAYNPFGESSPFELGEFQMSGRFVGGASPCPGDRIGVRFYTFVKQDETHLFELSVGG